MSFEAEDIGGQLAHYGTRDVEQTGGGKVDTRGLTKSVKYVFSFDDLPLYNSDFAAIIPTGSQLISATIKATTPFVGGTSYAIGLEQAVTSSGTPGTDIDADGIFDALTLAELNAGAMAIDNAFVLQGLPIAYDGSLMVVATGTFTAGVAELVVEYLEM